MGSPMNAYMRHASFTGYQQLIDESMPMITNDGLTSEQAEEQMAKVSIAGLHTSLSLTSTSLSRTALSDPALAALRAQWGKNEIPEEKEPLWKLFFMQFVGTMPAMIEIAGILSAILGSWVDFWIIFALLMTNATLGFIEEVRSACVAPRLLHSLRSSSPPLRPFPPPLLSCPPYFPSPLTCSIALLPCRRARR